VTALVLVPILAVPVSCGDDGDDVASTGTTAAEPTTTAEATTTTAADDASPTTDAPSTTTAAEDGATFPADSPEAAAAAAYETVFDSAASMEQKAPHIEDAEALEDVLAQYATVGTQFNGFTVEVKTVAINGNTAAVTYDLHFGGTKRYTDLPGTIENRNGTWTVTRAELCGFTASAGVTCP
jgi:iron complex transport system substrate-binding protein